MMGHHRGAKTKLELNQTRPVGRERSGGGGVEQGWRSGGERGRGGRGRRREGVCRACQSFVLSDPSDLNSLSLSAIIWKLYSSYRSACGCTSPSGGHLYVVEGVASTSLRKSKQSFHVPDNRL